MKDLWIRSQDVFLRFVNYRNITVSLPVALLDWSLDELKVLTQ